MRDQAASWPVVEGEGRRMTITLATCTAARHDAAAYDYGDCRCPAGREAHRLYRKRLREGRQPPADVPAIGTARKLQALTALHHHREFLAEQLGLSPRRVFQLTFNETGRVHRTTAARVDALFERLSATPGTSRHARIVTERYGFVPPLAWDDIDDPDAKPRVRRPTRTLTAAANCGRANQKEAA